MMVDKAIKLDGIAGNNRLMKDSMRCVAPKVKDDTVFSSADCVN